MRYSFLLGALPFALAAPLTERDEAAAPTKYIVVLKPDAPKPQIKADRKLPTDANAAAASAGAAVAAIDKDNVYSFSKFRGFSASLSQAQITALKSDPSVAYITVDGKVHTQIDASTQDAQYRPGKFETQETSPSWGLARLSSRKKGAKSYIYHSSAGAGTCSYIVDTGVDASHPEFEGRAEQIKNFASSATTDDMGHGSHVSGTIGSKSYGVAKKTKLLGVKVLDEYGSGEWSTVIQGIEYAVNDTATRGCPNGAVMNLSLGGPRSQAINDAVAAAVEAGVFVAVAAGNEGVNCDSTSPASEPNVFTVGAIDSIDNITSFSNYGALVDIFAPGLDILSTWPGNATNSISGTSMATPHVAGLAAYLLGYYGKLEPADLGYRIKQFASRGLVKNIFPNTGTPNLLAFNGRPLAQFEEIDNEEEESED